MAGRGRVAEGGGCLDDASVVEAHPVISASSSGEKPDSRGRDSPVRGLGVRVPDFHQPEAHSRQSRVDMSVFVKSRRQSHRIGKLELVALNRQSWIPDSQIPFQDR